MLDKLKNTSEGPDKLPPWYLRLAAPVFALPLAHLFNLSFSGATVPYQWKSSCITPVPKVSQPLQCEDFRPISVKPILSRFLEKSIIRQSLYPIFVHPEYTHLFSDQFAFRPTGSCTAAIITILHKITDLLLVHPYVHLIALDFSKAFDTVRHVSLFNKLAPLPVTDCTYNWLVDYFESRSHCTKLAAHRSNFSEINASFVQGFGLGPVAYAINAYDLRPLSKMNHIDKYADDTYLIVASAYAHLIPQELEHIAIWATQNNLQLNHTKTVEMIRHKPGRKRDFTYPPVFPDIARVTQMKILGVLLNDTVGFDCHIDNLVGLVAQSKYAIKLLRSHGLSGQSLWDITQATLVARMLYASQSWWGFLDQAARNRLCSALRRVPRLGLCSPGLPGFEELCAQADTNLFKQIMANPSHFLHQLLPPVKITGHNLRSRMHDRVLPNPNDSLSRKKFFNRMLFLNIY